MSNAMQSPAAMLTAPDATSDNLIDLKSAIDGACRRIAPLWPLKHFVAVNPFLGFSGLTFPATCAMMRRVARIEMLMPRSFYRQALADGVINDDDLEAALASAPRNWAVPRSVNALKGALGQDLTTAVRPRAMVATVTEVRAMVRGRQRMYTSAGFMVDEISKWCAAYFDEGQSVWRLPARELRPYPAWKVSMRHDRNPRMMGITGFGTAIANLPDDPVATIEFVVRELGVPRRALEEYLYQALSDVAGWVAYGRYLVWRSELHGRPDDTVVHLLAIRIAWGYALFLEEQDDAFHSAWRRAMEEAASVPQDEELGEDVNLTVDLLAQEAYEIGYQRRVLAAFKHAQASSSARAPTVRPPIQAAFCIDVRSEIYRRALETVMPAAQTIGFAGFFGYPIEYIPIAQVKGGDQCPVLLTPTFVVAETVRGASEIEEARILSLRLLRRRVSKAWKSFKLAAVSSFIYVETAGLLFVGKILSDSLSITRSVKDPNTDGLDKAAAARIGPRIESRTIGGRKTGFDSKQRLRQAEAVLRAMSMTGPFARLVLLVGHGSTTVNNPHGSSLDCGACGGHTGEANARVAAEILNDANVRKGLAQNGIEIPIDSWFLGCVHDTTTDEVRLFNLDEVPDSHAADIAALISALAHASCIARAERALLLGIEGDQQIDTRVIQRSRDWSQVRPEWGLAGNAAFIAGPRELTRGIDLGGRAFLHDYDWKADQDFKVLELIMTAPMVVASWINLAYYGATVNNRAFGSGNKVLHNVTGTIGVLEGNAGDLKIGLPWQSVHDGARFIHEPLRLNVFLAAPLDAINAVIKRHTHVRELVDNRWLHLYVVSDSGAVTHRYQRDQNWLAIGEF